MTLTDLHILDLGQGVAGAYAAKLFADYGADVIKVERPRGGDPSRRYGPFPDKPDRETGALWLYLNTNKRSITLDIAQPTGAWLFRRLVEHAQVIIESFPPGYLDSLGLGFQALTQVKRRIVLTSITPFGQSGPCAHMKATNLTSLASGGQMSVSGEPQREPLKTVGYQAEYRAGLHAFAASAIAAFNADGTELPEHIDISIQECMASMLARYLPGWAYLKRDISRGRGNDMSALVDASPAADDQGAEEFPHEAEAAHASIAFVHTLGDLLESPQLRARRYFHQVDHPRAGRLTYPGPPFLLSGSEWPRQGRGAPLLGEHNQEVYCGQLGLSREELSRLRAAEVV